MTDFSQPYDNSLTDLTNIPRLPERKDSLENQLHDAVKMCNQSGAWLAADFIDSLLLSKKKFETEGR